MLQPISLFSRSKHDPVSRLAQYFQLWRNPADCGQQPFPATLDASDVLSRAAEFKRVPLGRRSKVYVGTAAIGCPSSATRSLFIPIGRLQARRSASLSVY